MDLKIFENKKAQTIFYGVMVSLMLFLAVVSVLQPFKDVITNARAVGTGLDCDNTSISTGTKGACIIVDFSLPYWAGIMLALAAIYLTGKKLDVF